MDEMNHYRFLAFGVVALVVVAGCVGSGMWSVEPNVEKITSTDSGYWMEVSVSTNENARLVLHGVKIVFLSGEGNRLAEKALGRMEGAHNSSYKVVNVSVQRPPEFIQIKYDSVEAGSEGEARGLKRTTSGGEEYGYKVYSNYTATD
ncbi:hypothetical protein ACFQMA_18060 [Halosimplex aquaticum]|uniref:DUF4426 domain-containing protein n=1 Tax=Halosimplex aquaticum TaxID=3026162 RepID=A0ABD5Y8P5_9EURY|nr:hypothetical protein [Halosimplex aquaticum]